MSSKQKRWLKHPGRGTTGGVWQDQETGAQVSHCGHPTANYPYAIAQPDEERLIIAPNGMAFRLLAEAQAASELLSSGQLVLHRHRPGMARVANSERHPDISRTWEIIKAHIESRKATA